MLSELGQGQSKCPCYWPKSEQMFEYIKVVKETEEAKDSYIVRNFRIFNTNVSFHSCSLITITYFLWQILIWQTNDSLKLTQYHLTVWKSGVVPEKISPLLNLIELAASNNCNSGSPIVIHCSGGGDRSSLFLTLSSLIEQIRIDKRVDIFQTARYTRSQRQCMLQTIVS